MNKYVGLTLLSGFLFSALQAHADWFQLYRADTSTYISHAKVEIQNAQGTVVYTDYFGRFEVTLPTGRYTAIVFQDGWKKQFDIQVDGQNAVKVHRLP